MKTPPVILDAALPALFTTQEAIQYLRVSRSTIHRLRRAGQLVGHKVGSQWRDCQRDLVACVQGTAERSIL